jgi:hypothetical protein
VVQAAAPVDRGLVAVRAARRRGVVISTGHAAKVAGVGMVGAAHHVRHAVPMARLRRQLTLQKPAPALRPTIRSSGNPAK